MQDETAGAPIQEFCGLRAKLYSVKVDMEEKTRSGAVRQIFQKTATAGTKAHVAKRHLQHEKFVAVFNGQLQEVTVAQNSIRAYGHDLFNITQNKVALSAIDDKRFVLPDGTTRAHGHFRNYH